MNIKLGLMGLAAAAGLALFGGASGAAFASNAAPAPSEVVVEQAPPPPFFWVYEFPFSWVRLSIIDDAAQVIGMPQAEVREALEHGRSLAEIGNAHGVGEERLEAGTLRDEWDDLVRQVRNTPLTWEQAGRYYAELATHIEGIVHHHS
jgi:hypothetical protein